MYRVWLICVGSCKEKYWREAVAEYQKRLSGFLDAVEGTGIEVVWTAAEEGDGVRELKSFQEE